MRAPDTDRPRWRLSLLAAIAVHATAALSGSCERRAALTQAALELGSQFQIDIETVKAAPGSLPGGGSPEPDPRAAERALRSQPEISKRNAPAVPKAKLEQERPHVADEAVENPAAESESTKAPDLLAATEFEAFKMEPARPRAARQLDPRRSPTTTAREVATQEASTSRSLGSGPGAFEGPGGRGRGYGSGGVITKQFAFGGPAGAFRADVCFIPNTVTSLKQIGECDPVATFFTNVLNVPPRPFHEGFPGISERFEWFSIRYRGKFKVAAADYYRFRLLSDDGAILYIDGYQIIDNDGGHAPRSLQMTIPLEEGEHDLLVSYYQGPRENIALQLFVKPSNGPERLFGPTL